MSKPNRRKEIKEKEELQARFQLSMSQNNSKALKWLKPVDSTSHLSTSSVEANFFELPIIPNGASLSNLTLAKAQKNIGDFVNGTEIKPQLKVPAKSQVSKPMSALMNKMRDQSRDKVKKNKPKQVAKPVVSRDDSDLEDEQVRNRSVKKSTPLLFDGKKKKGRPF